LDLAATLGSACKPNQPLFWEDKMTGYLMSSAELQAAAVAVAYVARQILFGGSLMRQQSFMSNLEKQ
jgi:hypothetical protein